MQPLRLESASGSSGLSSLDEGTLPLSPGSEAQTKKRNRISFVCQACRRSKTKCDREKPRCSRCVQHGIQCIYDVEKQPAPKNPSKDATIARLEKEVDYWKNKAQLSSAERQKEDDASKRLREPTYPSEIQQPKKTKIWPTYRLSDTFDNIKVNLYRKHPSMIMNRVMKREVKPMSENYAVTQDTFLSGLIAAIFLSPSNNTMIPALSASASVSRALPSVRDNVSKLKEKLVSQCHSDYQKERINEFTERILQNSTNGRVRVGMLPNAIRASFDRSYLEDMCPSNADYSEVLRSFLSRLQDILPPLEILKSYKAHFYQHVYPNLPFLNRKLFEESLASTLFEDEDDPTKIKIKLGHSRLRNKMENLCILLVILKLSFISLLFIDEGSEERSPFINRDVIKKYPIGNEAILLAENVLSAENLFACANENIITCLLYIWSFFVYSPEEGDFFLEHPTDVLTGVIVMLATSIGLHRDPLDFSRMAEQEDPSVLNHRRVLWVAIITTVCIETSLKGRHPLSLDAAVDQFMEIRSPYVLEDYIKRIKQDMPNIDDFELKVQENCLKRSLLALLVYDMDKLSLTYKGTFRLLEMEELRGRIENFVADNFEIGGLVNIPINTKMSMMNGMNGVHGENGMNGAPESNNSSHNSVAMHAMVMSRLVLLRGSMALFYHFESAAIDDPELLPLYEKYLVRVCVDALTLIGLITKYFNGDYGASLLPSYCYNITKASQIALSSTFFGMLGIIIRIEMAGNMIYSQYQEEVSNSNSGHLHSSNQKMEILSSLKIELEIALESVYCVASRHLRFTYFSVFKMLALFDVIIQRMKKGELWSSMLRLQHVEGMNKRSVKALSMTLSLDLDGQNTVISQLKTKNHLVDLSVEQLNGIYREVRNVIHGDKPNGPSQASPVSSSGAFTEKGFTGNNLGNLEKLSSAAALSQNLNMQSNSMGASDTINANNTRIPPNNEAPLLNNNGNDFDMGSAVPMDFPGLFGGLDLFDYDFLFSNNG